MCITIMVRGAKMTSRYIVLRALHKQERILDLSYRPSKQHQKEIHMTGILTFMESELKHL